MLSRAAGPRGGLCDHSGVENYTRTLAVEVDQNLKEEKKKRDYPVLIATGRTVPAESAHKAVDGLCPQAIQQDRAGQQAFSALAGFDPEPLWRCLSILLKTGSYPSPCLANP